MRVKINTEAYFTDEYSDKMCVSTYKNGNSICFKIYSEEGMLSFDTETFLEIMEELELIKKSILKDS